MPVALEISPRQNGKGGVGGILTPPANTTSSTTSSTTSTSSTTTSSTTGSDSSTSTTETTSHSTSSGASTSTSSSSSSSSSSTSTSTSPTSSTATSTSTSTSTPIGGGIVTVTSTQITSGTSSISPSPSSTAAPSAGFFQNKGAVAGVFTVVGVIGLIALIVLLVNFVRRRRAEKFDREIAEAAAEAAAARAPAFLDDENDNYGPGYGAAAAFGKYSDVSHGTYSQPPMRADSYGMRELGPGPGEVYDPNVYGGAAGVGAAAGAAGIGVVRARSRRDGAFAAGLQEGTSPYPAFAGPQYGDVYNNSRTPPPPDFRGGAVAEMDPALIRRGPSQQTHRTAHSNMGRNRSVNGLSSDGHSSNQSHSYQAFDVPSALQPGVQRNPSVAQSSGHGVALGGHEETDAAPMPNPFSATAETHDIPEEPELSEEEEEEEEEPRRVLRVANE